MASSTTGTISAEVRRRLEQPSAIRFIRLGESGSWANEAFAAGTIPFKYRNVDHAPCSDGDWDAVRKQIAASGRKPGAIGGDIRELRDFYEADDHCLWITFADGHLWWTFSEGPVVASAERGDDRPARLRRAPFGWHRHNIEGEPLLVQSLSSALTKVAGYRRTLCAVERSDYLLRKIQGEVEPLVVVAKQLQTDLEQHATQMIAQLDWRDFEIMVDLIFARAGWQRESALGKGEVDLDLFLTNPTTSDSAWVQIKSSANQRVLDDYAARFRQSGADRFFFVCHSPKGDLSLPEDPATHIWTGPSLARRTIAAGLLDWLIDRIA